MARSPPAPLPPDYVIETRSMRRHLMGIFGLLLTIAGVVFLFIAGGDDSQWSMNASICLRAGLVLMAIWLAFPQLNELLAKYPPWTLILLPVALVVFFRNPKTIIILGPLLAILALLHFIGWVFKPLPTDQGKGGKKPPSSND